MKKENGKKCCKKDKNCSKKMHEKMESKAMKNMERERGKKS